MRLTFLFAIMLLSCSAGLTPRNESDDIDKTPAQWKHEQVREGLAWHNYAGYDPVSDAMQIVNVIEMDLDNPSLKLSFVYYPDKEILSNVADDNRALAATNASFGVPHTYIRIDGENICEIDIESTHRDWWKHEAAVLYDGKNNVSFLNFDGKPAEAVQAYRDATEPNILSGTPILIDNYKMPEWFFESVAGYKAKSSTLKQRHPRTAIATTADRKLLLITVDGRWEGRAAGMTCEELRQFLAKHFNPQYAMNMDGGGSSSMFVKGFGDDVTGIVSYPCEGTGETGAGYDFDHSHERKLPTFFVITEVKAKKAKKK